MGVKRPRKIEPLASQFQRLTHRDKSGCLLWTGIRDQDGYGIAKLGRSVRLRAHRVSWEMANDRPVPKGILVLHRCDNPPCVEPSHLFIGTVAENNADCVRKGRNRHGKHYDFGEKNGCSKLTDAQRDEIVAISGETQTSIAIRYGMSHAQISVIRRTWAKKKQAILEATGGRERC